MNPKPDLVLVGQYREGHWFSFPRKGQVLVVSEGARDMRAYILPEQLVYVSSVFQIAEGWRIQECTPEIKARLKAMLEKAMKDKVLTTAAASARLSNRVRDRGKRGV